MCAINGFNFKDDEIILKMNSVNSHRGPDGTGVFSEYNMSFGHNRLSIIDLSDVASQPMISDDNNLVIVFNGEIYNFEEIKKELKDYKFNTKSDTEVILASYKKWGKDCVRKFNGIFAFAIWDKNKKELFLARDHIGVKPLYYFWDGKRFIFSSEIKAILEHNVPRILNKESFNHYLRVLYVPEPLTMFECINKLPPASVAILKNNKLVIEKYWEVGPVGVGEYFDFSKKDLSERLKEQVMLSVKNQLISDKPLGVYLSGGIDSSIILHSVMSARNNIDTFSVGFELQHEEESEKFNIDFNLARATSQYYGTNHNEVLLSPKDVLDYFEKVVWQMDEPISNPTAISMAKLANFAKGKVDVVLGGEGGDELFGGYERYRYSLVASSYQMLPKLFRDTLNISTKLNKLNTPAGIERFRLFMFQKDAILERVINSEFLNYKITNNFFEEKYFRDDKFNSFEELFMETDRKSWLVDQALSLSDKMSMFSGIEARVPLLDKELVEFSSKIPLHHKLDIFNTKKILKDSFRGLIPDFLYNQPKRGFFSPGAKWLRIPTMYEKSQEVLSNNYYNETNDMFKWDELRQILKEHNSKKEYNLTIIWALITFQIWAKRYRIIIN